MSLSSLLILVAMVTAQVDAPPISTQPTQPAPSSPSADAGAPPPPAAAPPEPPPPPAVDVEAGIRAAYQTAESQQGPLDGRWTLVGADGTALFAFVLADTGGAPSSRAASPGSSAIEGAWRDLRRAGGANGSGLLVSVTHLADTVEIRFYEADPASATVVTLQADGGGWSGSLMEGGVSRPVSMKRS